MAERDVLLFRHGPAEDRGPGWSDAERALTRPGRRATATAARGLANLLAVRPHIITSPARRACETADILASVWPGVRAARDERLAPGAAPQALRACVLDQEASLPTVLVGHEPDLTGCLAALLGAPPGTRFKLGKAGVAWLRCDATLSAPAVLRMLASRQVLSGSAS